MASIKPLKVVTSLRSFLCLLLMLGIGFSVAAQEQQESKVRIKTVFGDMIVKLYNDTPIHRDNFLKRVRNGEYDGTLIHRVLPYFVMQGGNPISKGAEPGIGLSRDKCEVLPAEIRPHHIHKKGALAAARLNDDSNPDRNSSACQFYIVHGYKVTDDNLDSQPTEYSYIQRAWYKVRGGEPFLDGKYTVFGEVVEGLEIIDLISGMTTAIAGDAKARPLEDIVMTIELVR